MSPVRIARLGLVLVLTFAVAVGPGGRASAQGEPDPAPDPLEALASWLERADEGDAPRRRLAELIAAAGGAGALVRTIARLESKLLELRAENDRLRTRIAEGDAEREATLAARAEELVAVKKEARARAREIQTLRDRVEGLEARVQRLVEEKRQLAEERARLRVSLEDATRQLEELAAALEHAWRERDERDEALADLEEQVEALRAERDRLRARLREEERARQELAERNGRARELARLALAELERLEGLWRQAERRNAVLAAQLEGLRAVLARRGAELDAARASERRLAGELARLREEQMRLLRDGVRRLLEGEIGGQIAPLMESEQAAREEAERAGLNAALGRLGFQERAGGWMRPVPSEPPVGLAALLRRIETVGLPLALGVLLRRDPSLVLAIRLAPPAAGEGAALDARAEAWRRIVQAYGVDPARVRIVRGKARESDDDPPAGVLWLEVRGGGR